MNSPIFVQKCLVLLGSAIGRDAKESARQEIFTALTPFITHRPGEFPKNLTKANNRPFDLKPEVLFPEGKTKTEYAAATDEPRQIPSTGSSRNHCNEIVSHQICDQVIIVETRNKAHLKESKRMEPVRRRKLANFRRNDH